MDSRNDFFCDLIFTFFGGSRRPFFRGVWRFSEIADYFKNCGLCIWNDDDDCFNKATRLLESSRSLIKVRWEWGGDSFQKLRCAMSWTQGLRKKAVSEGVKPIESLPRHFCGLMIHIKHRKNCECCPVSQLIVRSQRLSWIQVLNCQNCSQCLKCHKSLG